MFPWLRRVLGIYLVLCIWSERPFYIIADHTRKQFCGYMLLEDSSGAITIENKEKIWARFLVIKFESSKI